MLGPLAICLRARWALRKRRRNLVNSSPFILDLPKDKEGDQRCCTRHGKAQERKKNDSQDSPAGVFTDGRVERGKIDRSTKIRIARDDRVGARAQNPVTCPSEIALARDEMIIEDTPLVRQRQRQTSLKIRNRFVLLQKENQLERRREDPVNSNGKRTGDKSLHHPRKSDCWRRLKSDSRKLERDQ